MHTYKLCTRASRGEHFSQLSRNTSYSPLRQLPNARRPPSHFTPLSRYLFTLHPSSLLPLSSRYYRARIANGSAPPKLTDEISNEYPRPRPSAPIERDQVVRQASKLRVPLLYTSHAIFPLEIFRRLPRKNIFTRARLCKKKKFPFRSLSSSAIDLSNFLHVYGIMQKKVKKKWEKEESGR